VKEANVLSDDELIRLRFGMSELPKTGGAPGDYQEKLTQWFLERSFFRDFTYRNPQGKKKGEELADAVVLFDDVALLVQVKAQCGNHNAQAWATEATLKALKQVRVTHDNLKSGAIKKLKNEVYGELNFDPVAYPNMIGIIILAQDSTPYNAKELVPEIGEADFPVYVFSLKDIALLTHRFDTAADFVNFIELRTDIGDRESFLVNDEERNLLQMIPYVPAIYAYRMKPISANILDKTVEAFRKTATGELVNSPAWQYSLAVDDMIARAHDIDPSLPWNNGLPSVAADVARFLGWLTRDRRIKLGKRILDMCVRSAQDHQVHQFCHYQKSRGAASVYLVSSLSREERVKYLEFLVSYAHFKYGAVQSFGVATDAGVGGRSHDFVLSRKQLTPEAIEILKTFDDPFGDSNNQL
jgi:hypothetical protein